MTSYNKVGPGKDGIVVGGQEDAKSHLWMYNVLLHSDTMETVPERQLKKCTGGAGKARGGNRRGKKGH